MSPLCWDDDGLVGAEWASYVENITSKACISLGVPPKAVTAELYKLVLYEAGSFFVPHRDTEKADGMFGTLVIVLPSIYKVPLLAVLLGNAKSITPTMVPFSISALLQQGSDAPSCLSYYAETAHGMSAKGLLSCLAFSPASTRCCIGCRPHSGCLPHNR